jgi:hypothetical protein
VETKSAASRAPQFKSLVGQRPDYHDHLAAFHLGEVLHPAHLFGVFSNTLEQFTAQILVRHLAATEAQSDLHLVATFKKLEDVPHFHIVVIRVRVRAELDLFDLDDLLLLTGFALTLLLFLFELAKIHDLTDRRIGVGRNLDQVEPSFVGHFHGTRRGHNADVFSVRTDQADFVRADLVVDARAGVTLGRRVMRSASDGDGPLIVTYSETAR